MFSLVPWKKRNETNVPVKRSRRFSDSSLAEFRDEFDAIWDRFWGHWHRRLDPWDKDWDEDFGFALTSKFEDQEDKCVLRAELPGFEPDEIDLNVSGNVLTIVAERKDEKSEKGGTFYHHGSYRQQFTVPPGIVKEQIEARYHNGILEVALPKGEASKAKRIHVSTS